MSEKAEFIDNDIKETEEASLRAEGMDPQIIESDDAILVTNSVAEEACDSNTLVELNASVCDVPDIQTEELTRKLDTVIGSLEKLENMFEKRLLYDEGKERILDKLHGELQTYKTDLYNKLTQPIFYDMIAIFDDLRKTKIHYQLTMGEITNTAVQLIDEFSDTILFTLDKYGVTQYQSEQGEQYVAQKQRLVKTMETSELEKVGSIAESIAPGFLRDRRVIFPEKVIIFKYKNIKE